MNFKEKAAKKLEQFIESEVKQGLPLTEMKNGNVVFNDMFIQQNKHGLWSIRSKRSDVLKEFNLKSCEIAASKFYTSNDFKKYFEIISLDSEYSKSATDAEFFKSRINATNDAFLQDMYSARYSESHARAEHAKRKISASLKTII